MPADVDVSKDKPFVVVFTGMIGAERGVAGKVFSDGGTGDFVFTPSTLPKDGVAGSRVLAEDKGRWHLSRATGDTSGNLDWKGQYRNGRPTAVLSWAGPDSRYFDYDGSAFGKIVYRRGEVFSVAPCPVLGAALTEDEDDTDWLVAICRQGGRETAYRRPAKRSDSPALYDPTESPEGWRVIGEADNQSGVEAVSTPWLFNGSGTEATTMRLTAEGHATRLQAALSLSSFSVVNRGNTKVSRSVETERTWENCESIYFEQLIWESKRWETVGETTVAADYIDDSLVLGTVEVDEEGFETVNVYPNSKEEHFVQKLKERKARRVTLHVPGRVLALESVDYERVGVANHVQRSRLETTRENMNRTVHGLDLRYKFVLYEERKRSWRSVTTFPKRSYNGENVSWAQEVRGLKFISGSGDKELEWNIEPARTRSWNVDYGDEEWMYLPAGYCFDAPQNNQDQHTSSDDAYYEQLQRLPLKGSFAHNRKGELFLSFRHKSDQDMTNVYSYLSGTDPYAVVGVPDDTLFQDLAAF